jgi:outer membrane protein TolC
MINRLYLLVLLLVTVGSATERTITFESLFATLVEKDAKIQALQHNVAAKEKAIHAEMGLAPSEVNLETSNFGTDAFSLSFGQEFELGGQRKKRANTIRKEMAVIEAEIVLRKIERESELGSVYLEAVSFQERVQFLDSLEEIMTSASEWLEKSVNVGSGAKIDVMRMELDLKDVLFSKEQFKREFASRIEQINVLCETELSASTTLNFSLQTLTSVNLTEAKTESPYESLIQQQIIVEQERIKEIDIPLIPNLTVEGGVTHSNSEDATYGDFNVGIALPLFSRRSSRVEEQQLVVEATQKDASSVTRDIISARTTLSNRVDIIKSEITFIETEMLPGNEAVLAEMNRMIQVGVFSFIDYQASRREFISMKERQYELLEELGKTILTLKMYNGDIQNVIQ